MKKYTFILFFLVVFGNSAFCVDFSLSAGGGGLLGYNFTRYTMEVGGAHSTQKMDRINYAGFLFFDATYGEFTIMFQGGNNSYEENMIYESATLTKGQGTGTETSIGFSLMGKYPFAVNEKITWFPMLGAEFQIALIQRRTPEGDIEYNRAKGLLASDRDKDDNPYPLSAWNSFWINIGAGLDYNIIGPLFLRSELIFGFRLPTGYELGALELAKKMMNDPNPKLMGLTGGPSLKVGIGYRF